MASICFCYTTSSTKLELLLFIFFHFFIVLEYLEFAFANLRLIKALHSIYFLTELFLS